MVLKRGEDWGLVVEWWCIMAVECGGVNWSIHDVGKLQWDLQGRNHLKPKSFKPRSLSCTPAH